MLQEDLYTSVHVFEKFMMNNDQSIVLNFVTAFTDFLRGETPPYGCFISCGPEVANEKP